MFGGRILNRNNKIKSDLKYEDEVKCNKPV